jgi:CRISPR-associated protein Cmr2
MSAGILIVHYKHPLYDALDKARSLERKAKEHGRNAVAVGYLARSGTYNEVVFNWNIVPELGKFVELIKNSEKDEEPSLSKRIIYHVTQEVDNLPNDEKALREYLKYEFSRHYRGYDEVEDLADDVIGLAKNVRIKLSKEDFTDLQDFMADIIKRSSLNRINSEILDLISKNDLTCGRLYDRLKTILCDYLKENSCDFYEKLYGLILKKQIKGLFILLKILVDCDAELGGGSCEDSNRT